MCCLAPEIAFCPDESGFLEFCTIGQTSPFGSTVTCHALETRIEILMHIEIEIDAVFCTKIGNLFNFVKEFFVIFEGFGFDRIPGHTESDKVKAVLTQSFDCFFIEGHIVCSFFSAVLVITLVAKVDAVEYSFSALGVDEFLLEGCDFFHSQKPLVTI